MVRIAVPGCGRIGGMRLALVLAEAALASTAEGRTVNVSEIG